MTRVLIVAEIRLYREGLAQLLGRKSGMTVVGVKSDLREAAADIQELVVLDVATAESHATVRDLKRLAPGVAVVALGVGRLGGDILAEVHEVQTITAEIAIAEKEIADVKPDQKVVLKARAHPQMSFQGVVTAVAPIATKQEDWRSERTILVITQLDNTSLLLKPEMSGMAKIYCGERRSLDLLLRRLMRYVRVEFWSWW